MEAYYVGHLLNFSGSFAFFNVKLPSVSPMRIGADDLERVKTDCSLKLKIEYRIPTLNFAYPRGG